jgi:hypothetical protein
MENEKITASFITEVTLVVVLRLLWCWVRGRKAEFINVPVSLVTTETNNPYDPFIKKKVEGLSTDPGRSKVL